MVYESACYDNSSAAWNVLSSKHVRKWERMGKKGKTHFHLNPRPNGANVLQQRCVSETSHLLLLFVERCKIYGQPYTLCYILWVSFQRFRKKRSCERIFCARKCKTLLLNTENAQIGWNYLLVFMMFGCNICMSELFFIIKSVK